MISYDTVPCPPPWWTDHGKIFTLLRWLEDRAEIATIDDAIRVVEKPWNWDAEYQQMQREDTEDRAEQCEKDARSQDYDDINGIP
jgi:hypothetical protein